MTSISTPAAAGAEPLPPTVPQRVVLISIAGFWLFYFAIVTVRGIVIGYPFQPELFVTRALVAVAGMAITYAMSVALRALARISFRAAVIGSALIAIPGAILYSTINWYGFREFDRERMAEKGRTVVIRQPGDGRGKGSRTIVIRESAGSRSLEIAPLPEAPPMPPPPPPPDEHSVIKVEEEAEAEEGHTAVAMIAENAANGYFFLVAYAALYLALTYAAGARAAERRAATFRAAAQAAELRALRYQINPHFLFNTLNSLSSLVLVDRREEAEKMILNLSNFFRTSLTADPAEDQPLSEEIRLQRLYLEIERVRFPDRLACDVNVPDHLASACVPALILQPLVENAIKYGVSRSREAVTIHIEAREEDGRLVLAVANNGRPVQPVGENESGTGLGLRNVRDRLAARFGDAGQCSWSRIPGGGFLVTLTMPIVRHGC